MQIRIDRLAGRATDALLALDGQTGVVAAYVLRPMDQESPVLVSVWDSAEDAQLAVRTEAAQDFVNGSFHEAGTAGDAAYAQIIYFDGPRSQVEANAFDRANRERIAPAVRTVRS